MEEKKTPTKSVIYYYASVLITMILMNALLFPLIMDKQITKVDYGTFITKVDSGLVKTVSIQEDVYSLENKHTDQPNNVTQSRR